MVIVPDLKEVYDQVEKMFCEFHKQLHTYDHRRFCQCKACTGAVDLTLKVITHYGEFTGYNVKNFNKLIGKGYNRCTPAFKNDIDQHEYWLVTDGLGAVIISLKTFPAKLNWNKSSKQTETGTIPFSIHN